jgi:hypothetical protein
LSAADTLANPKQRSRTPRPQGRNLEAKICSYS